MTETKAPKPANTAKPRRFGLRHLWDGRPTLFEGRIIGPYMIRPALAFARAVSPSNNRTNIPNTAKKSNRLANFLKRNLLDIGVISSASFFFAVWSLGSLPLSVAAGAGLASVLGVRAYQEIFTNPKKHTPEYLNRKGGLSLFINRPGAAYTLSSLTTLSTCFYIAAMAVGGAVPGLGLTAMATTKFISLMTFGFVFSASNNIKAARLDRERGYDVKPFLPLRALNPSWSEKLSIVGNIARNFIAGPVAGFASLPIMREALKFSRRDKEHELQTGVSYTDTHIAPLYDWKQPRSDSGMSRRLSGVASLFAAAAAGVAGDPKAAVSLAYPAVAMFILGAKSDESYRAKRQRTAQNPQP